MQPSDLCDRPGHVHDAGSIVGALRPQRSRHRRGLGASGAPPGARKVSRPTYAAFSDMFAKLTKWFQSESHACNLLVAEGGHGGGRPYRRCWRWR